MILAFIQALLGRVIKDTLMLTVVMNFIQEILNYGTLVGRPALAYIVEASGRDMTNAERFDYVVNKLKSDFPSVTGDFIRSVVQSTFLAWSEGKLQK